PVVIAPEPNTYREVLDVLETRLSLAGKRVYVQEYGIRNYELLEGLAARGAATVVPVPIYGYGLPKDTAALEAAIERIASLEMPAALFTSQTQVFHLFEVAEKLGRADALRRALETHTVIASVGPITTEALARYGLAPDYEPEHPKMGHLIAGLARALPTLLEAKRGR
ncbi:MAG: uroporphyrinogen-III synthase, partial [Polyangiaceae bacterium]|nr:uroporphyrinogen-III synthase [Polyangiaceae bacterium]